MKNLLLTCLLFGIVAAHDFKNCASETTDHLGITEVDVFPDPAQIGKNIEVTIKGKTDASTTVAAGAHVHLSIKLFSVEIAHLDLDVCTQLGLTCPIKPGSDFSAKVTYPVPAQAPGGITVDIDIQFNNTDKSDLGCITLQEKLVKPSELLTSEADSNQFLFVQWAKQYNKNYDVEEVFERMKIFSKNMGMIKAHNEANVGWTMGMNEFGDLTAEEFASHYHGLLPPRSEYLRSKNAPTFPKDLKPLDSIDWTTKGAVTPVKNQGQCGSCWAFSTTGSIEGAHEIATNKLVSLSEQELVDCAGSSGNQGCNGGLMDNAFEWVIKNGLCEEGDYPYKARGGFCQKSKCKAAAHITGYKDIPKGDEDALKTAVNLTPVSIAIEADQSSFQFYSGGVMDGICGKKLDHGVLLVGYGTDGGKDYWKIKNSWGASWGESGYIRVIRGKDQCGLADAASYPTGASSSNTESA
jgi:hypothetical protein